MERRVTAIFSTSFSETGPAVFEINESYERRQFSQNGEDGVIARIFDVFGTTNKVSVELGTGMGSECNTRALVDKGWQGLMIDNGAYGGPYDVKQHQITAENIDELLTWYSVPQSPDLLSIDLDGMDWWVWRAITRTPRVVVIEYNAYFSPQESCTLAYSPAHEWDRTRDFGASLAAMVYLGKQKGYTLVYCEKRGVNAFFVRSDLFEPVPWRELWQPDRMKYPAGNKPWDAVGNDGEIFDIHG